MTLLKDNNYKDINVALLSLEADIKNKITGFDTSAIDKQLAEINSRIDKINAGGGNNSSDEIEDINSKLNINSTKIRNIKQNVEDINTQINGIEQKLSDIFSADNKVTDFNTTTNSGIYYWLDDTTNRPTDYGVLLVNKYDRGDNNSIWVNQIAYGTNNKIYFRQNINSGNWTEWKAVAFDGEITAKKVANALTVNGKTYDGSSAVNAGVQTVANGGTGATNAATAFNTLADGVRDSSTPGDNEKMLLKPTGTWYKTTCLDFWNYIKGKISSVLGLTKDNYGGKAGTAGTADKVASEGVSAWWIEGREYAICKTTSAANVDGWKALASIKTASGSIEIGNLSGEDFIRVVYSSDANVNAGNNNVTQLLYIRRGNIETPHEVIANSAKASSKMVIPIGAPSSLEDGCIWIS